MRLVILVVDDEKPILEMFARAMRHRHEVILEQFGKRALERLLGPQEIDITFLDLMMPDVTGAEILRTVRARAPARLERLVVSTGAMAIPGVEELLKEYRIPTTGDPLALLEKPYGIEDLAVVINRYTMCFAPRGPRYPREFIKARTPSRPDLAELDDADEEVSAVTSLADAKDPIGVAIRDLRRDDKEHVARLAKLEAHFEDGGEGKRGLVRQIDANVAAIRSSFSFIKVSIPIIAVILGGLIWLINAVNKPPTPERVDYERIVREVSKQQPKGN